MGPDNETLTKFEIIDGAPVKDQCVPVRLYLTGFDLTPTYKNVQNKFSVKYFLSLVLVDEETVGTSNSRRSSSGARRLVEIVRLVLVSNLDLRFSPCGCYMAT